MRSKRAVFSLASPILGSFIALTSATHSFAGNLSITVKDGTTLPTRIVKGQTLTAYFTVKNMTNKARSGYRLVGLNQSLVKQSINTQSCPAIINLTPGGTCTLQLDILAPVHSGFAIANGNSVTKSSVDLNVTLTTNSPLTTVGFYINNSTGFAPLSYTSTNAGSSWTVSSAPLPLPNDVIAIPANQVSKLSSVTCDSTGQLCSAVGEYTNTSNGLAPLSYTSTNGGGSWSLSAALPLPTDVTATPALQDSELNGVH